MTDTVREKFEARFNPDGKTGPTDILLEAMFEIYKAGRESMREEAIKETVRRMMADGVMCWVHKDAEDVAQAIKELP